MLAMVDRFARYGLPLHLTETSLVSGDLMPARHRRPQRLPGREPGRRRPTGEARQADELVRHYRSLVAHPSVEAITYWGITDRGAWLGAPIGLVRADGSRKPGYDALHALHPGRVVAAADVGANGCRRPLQASAASAGDYTRHPVTRRRRDRYLATLRLGEPGLRRPSLTL